MVTYRGDDPHADGLMVKMTNVPGTSLDAWVLATDDQKRAIRIDAIAKRIQRDDILCCDSALVEALLRADFEGFDAGELENLMPDPSDWDADDCKEWLEEHGHDVPERDEDTDDDNWREELQDGVNELAECAEVYEWYRITGWLCSHLRDLGRVVIDNDYGYWWGRTCTGQALIMDGVLQEVAAQIVKD